jgi:hypothetical protein
MLMAASKDDKCERNIFLSEDILKFTEANGNQT